MSQQLYSNSSSLYADTGMWSATRTGGNQNISSGIATGIIYDTIAAGSDPYLTLKDSTSGWIIVQKAGIFYISAGAQFANSSTTGVRVAYIQINQTYTYGTTNQVSAYVATTSDVTVVNTKGCFKLNVGDVIQVIVVQDSGGSLAVTGTSTINITRQS